MSGTSERFRSVAGAFSERVDGVGASDWDRPSPCEGWTVRDLVAHVVGNATRVSASAGCEVPALPSTADDPVAAWMLARDTLQAALEDERVAQHEIPGPMGPSTLEQTIALFGIGDVLVHTWDLARATGQDERLDLGEVHRLLESMKPRGATLQASGHFGPPIDVPDDADEQTQLLSLTGRRVGGR